MIVKRDCIFTAKGENRPLHIYLPEGYEESEERYPVMYFFDGHNLYRDEDATYGKSWGLETFLDGWAKHMIIVGLECSHKSGERLNEYSPYSFSNPYMGDIHGTGDETMQWIIQEVKPMIDREYRTYAFREATGIAGSSMGGLMALYGCVKYNDVFSKAACLSSAIYSCFGDVCADTLNAYLDADTRVYLSWGTEEAGGTQSSRAKDMLSFAARRNSAVEALLKVHDVTTMLYCQRYGHHCEADWEKQVPLFMDFLWMR